MGVKPCEIELRRFLLLIGEQASGKSTIAKLIYFFQTLPDVIYNNTLLGAGRGSFDFAQDINKIARTRFIDTFGPTTRNEGLFNIEFWYDDIAYLRIEQHEDRFSYAQFEQNMGFRLGGAVQKFLQTPPAVGVENILKREHLLTEIYRIFNQVNTKFNYVIAGRNTVVAYPDLIGEKVKNELEKILEDEVREQDVEKKKRRGNEMLFLEFVEWSEGIRKYFRENGGTFDDVLRNLQLQNQSALQKISRISSLILKSTYKSNDWGESLRPIGSRLPIALKDASSGQQEVLRILQGLFISIGSQNRQEFMVIEEPEAHLYPLAQKELINAFAIFLNNVLKGKLVITTHSPYILACINILLFASFVSQKTHEEKLNIPVPQEYWLNSLDFSAYSLGQHEEYCIDIKNSATGLISQNYLDKISEELGIAYHQLYDILTLSA